jgi:spore coat protein CotH
MRAILLSCHVLAAVVVLGSAVPVRAQSFTDVFESGSIHEVRLFMHSHDAQLLHDQFLENTFYPADLDWGGVRIRNVGIRSRGLGSRNGAKPALLIEVDRYARGQTFAGRRAIVLDNLTQDPSMVRDRVAMAFFRRMGEPAPLQSVVRVSINNEDHGIYAIMEGIDADFLARTFGVGGGYLHEFHWVDEYYLGDLGGRLDKYKERFEPRTREHEPDRMVYGPLREMVAAIEDTSNSAWRSRVDEYVDLEQVVTHAAIETFMAEWDGILGYAGVNNFYLYRPEGSTRHQFLPWDRDNAFHDLDSGIFEGVAENALLGRALREPDLYTKYLNVLDAAALAADGWLAGEISRAAGQAVSAAVNDPRKPYSTAEQERAVAFLLEFARSRPPFVRAQVAAARGASALR